MSAATMPTKSAAMNSMESMKRSMNLVVTPSPLWPPEPAHGDGGGISAAVSRLRTIGSKRALPRSFRQYAALYCASVCLSSFMMASGSPPALRTLSAHCFSSGSADFFHSLSCASVIG